MPSHFLNLKELMRVENEATSGRDGKAAGGAERLI